MKTNNFLKIVLFIFAFFISFNIVKASTEYVVFLDAVNIRTGPDTTYKKIGAYSYNTRVPILERQGNWGKTDVGWICLNYTNASSSNINDVKFFKDYTYIYSNPDLTGTIYNYIPNTSVIVLENVSNYVDKVKVRMTRKNRLYKRK